MVGRPLAEQGVTREIVPPYYSVKEAVFPFVKFPGVDPILGPEMKSTGEVMGVGQTFAEAFYKAQLAAGVRLPTKGRAFISVKPKDRPAAVEIARKLHALGFELVATRGTAGVIAQAGIPVRVVNKVTEGRPHIVDMIKERRDRSRHQYGRRGAPGGARFALHSHERARGQGLGDLHHHRRGRGRLPGHRTGRTLRRVFLAVAACPVAGGGEMNTP